MKQHLRIIAEIGLLGAIALLVPVAAVLAMGPLISFLDSRAAGLAFVLRLAALALWFIPFPAALLYGFGRNLDMRPLPVWLGWTLAYVLYALAQHALVLRPAHLHSGELMVILVWVKWAPAIVCILLLSLLLSALTVCGRWWRIRIAPS